MRAFKDAIENSLLLTSPVDVRVDRLAEVEGLEEVGTVEEG